jgi:hypothetical protein
MPEATKTRLSINRRIRELFRANPLVPMQAGTVCEDCELPPHTAITARIREIRNHPRDPMNIKCKRVSKGGKALGKVLTVVPARLD